MAFDESTADAVAAAKRIFVDPADLIRVLHLSGGHLRSLLVMLTELLDWVDELPIPTSTLDRYVPRAAKDLARGLPPDAKEVLREVASSKEASGDPWFFDLLRNHYVFAYESGEDEYWYEINPLQAEIII